MAEIFPKVINTPKLTLDEPTHTYRHSDHPDMKFTSVTTVLGSYHKEFDTEFHATRVAAKEGVTKEEIIQRWDDISREASEYGTSIHHTMERYLLTPQRMYVPRNNFEKTLISSFQRMCQDEKLTLLTHYNVKPEHIMYFNMTGHHMDPEQSAGIAGTADIIEDLPGNRFNVWDFKTNKKMTYDNPYDNWLYFPVDHLIESKYTLYCLQISIYALMYEHESGRKFNRGGLVYWERETESWSIIPVTYMKREAEMLLSHFKQSVFPTVTLK